MKQEIPWNRFSIEAVVIVGSILLAFAIDAWWSERQERQEAERLLALLTVELNENIDRVNGLTPYRDIVWDVTQELFLASTGQEEVTANKFHELIADLAWAPSVDFSVGAIDSFLEGGKISLIDDPQLNSHLAEVKINMETIREIELQEMTLTNEKLLPYFYRFGSPVHLSAIIADRGQPGGEDRILQESLVFVDVTQDNRDLLSDNEFLGIVMFKGWGQADSLNRYRIFKEEVYELLDLIASF